MERLEKKNINGHEYYYYSKWGKVNGKCKRIWQKYLGKLEDIVRAVEGNGQAPLYAEVFEFGLATTMWRETVNAKVITEIDQLYRKRQQGLSMGEYLSIAAINRAMSPVSKESMWDWFNKTSLMRCFPNASKAGLCSKRFWDHMDKISKEDTLSIWRRIITGVVKTENIDISSISYDGTNFYTFISTFNMKCQLAQRGKNKQGRNNLKQVSYALFCSADTHIPLFYDVYEGNRNDSKHFPLMIEQFHTFLKGIYGEDFLVPKTTLIFDKGNNSPDNFALLDSFPSFNFVGSVKLEQVKDLAKISNEDPVFEDCPGLEGTKAIKLQKELYGKVRTIVVSYNETLHETQLLTLHNDINKAVEKLQTLQQRLQDRADGIIKKGKTPTIASIKKQCNDILSRPYMKAVIPFEVLESTDNIPRLQYQINTRAIDQLSDTHLGKTIIITNMEQWEKEKIISAYRSQFIIEDVFKEMKDRNIGTWWPLLHWTDQKIYVHGLYCTIAILLRALAFRRIRNAGIKISLKRMLKNLSEIKEIVNIYPSTSKGRGKKKEIQHQTVLTRLSELQNNLLDALHIERGKK